MKARLLLSGAVLSVLLLGSGARVALADPPLDPTEQVGDPVDVQPANEPTDVMPAGDTGNMQAGDDPNQGSPAGDQGDVQGSDEVFAD